jgi:putative membrane protein
MRINTFLKPLAAAAAAAAMLGAAPAHAQAVPEKPAAAAPASAALSKGDQKIVMDMAQANMAEIESAKMAQGKTQNAEVKTFAQQMIDDHTKALTEVQQLASAKGVTMPTEVDKRHKAMADKLAAMSGDAFDKAYLAQCGVAEHKKVHAMLASAAKKARDPDLKALAGRMEPTVEQHMKAAQQLGKAKPAAATGAGK